MVKGYGGKKRLTVLLEFPFKCKPLSKRGEDALLLSSLEGPGEPEKHTRLINASLSLYSNSYAKPFMPQNTV